MGRPYHVPSLGNSAGSWPGRTRSMIEHDFFEPAAEARHAEGGRRYAMEPAHVVARVCAAIAGSIALLSLIGWLEALQFLKNWMIGGVFMNPVTAVLILATAVALALDAQPAGKSYPRYASGIATAVLLAAATKLASVWNPSVVAVDRIFFRQRLGTNQMAPNTAVGLLLLALALLAGHLLPEFHRLQRTFTILAGGIAGVSILGYLYGASALYSVGQFIPMAFNTALALGILSIGIGSISGRGRWVALLLDGSSAGLLMRRLFPAAVMVPAFLGWLRLLGSRAGLYSQEIGVALFVAATTGIFGALALWIVRSVEMLERTRTQTELIAQQKVKLETEIVERERASQSLLELNRELAVARDAAVEASRMKSAILANVSHEFRTPLTVILGYLGLLRESAPAEGETVEILDTLEESARRLNLLIDDFISLASIEAGLTKVKREWFEIRPVLESCVADAMGELSINGNTVITEFSAVHGSLNGDREKFERALNQLLTNAGKFTSKGRITIRACRDREKGEPENLQIEVADTGIGISPAQLDRLFKPFVQLDDGPSRAYGGVGLGLVLARRLCQIMCGELLVQSEAGHGSSFTIRLPVDPGAAAIPMPGRASVSKMPAC